MFKYVAAIVIALATPATSAVIYDEATKSLEVTGVTTNYQANKVYKAMKDKDVLTIALSGAGGNYYAGLRIGALIKDEGSIVIIPLGTTCVSACAFAALGGDKVIIDGELWFHTPYLSNVPTDKTLLEIAQMFGRAYVDMTSYLARMDIPMSFGHDLLVRTTRSKFVVIDDGGQIDRMRATEALWVKAIYEYRYATSGE
jgi:hypothetical protein|tara:strand:+ start:914 stop:1510 length:597 start_codon:yes stop_codon:yes gene_type:complete